MIITIPCIFHLDFCYFEYYLSTDLFFGFHMSDFLRWFFKKIYAYFRFSSLLLFLTLYFDWSIFRLLQVWTTEIFFFQYSVHYFWIIIFIFVVFTIIFKQNVPLAFWRRIIYMIQYMFQTIVLMFIGFKIFFQRIYSLAFLQWFFFNIPYIFSIILIIFVVFNTNIWLIYLSVFPCFETFLNVLFLLFLSFFERESSSLLFCNISFNRSMLWLTCIG